MTPEKLLHKFKLANATYVIFGEEIGPVSGKLHYQGYVQWQKRIRATTLKKHFDGVYFKPSDGSPLSNMHYCSKDGKVWTFGEPKPTAAEAGGFATASKFEHISELAAQGKYGEIRRLYPSEAIRYGRGIMGLRNFVDRPPVPKKFRPAVYWFYGEGTGCGKTHAVFEMAPDLYDKEPNKWWDDYQFQPDIHIEEVSPEDHPSAYHIKKWLDERPFNAEFKGGSWGTIRPRRIFITSNYSIDEIYNPRDAACVKRRCMQIKKFISRDNVITEKDASASVCQEDCPQGSPCPPIQAQDAPSPVS